MRISKPMWADVKERDLEQCAACGARDGLSHQHRRAVGMGGSKAAPTFEDSLTLCIDCNGRCERDLQTRALAQGWKVRRWVQDPSLVPVLFPLTYGWARLTKAGLALPISAAEAAAMMRDVYGTQWDAWCAEVGVKFGRR